MMNSVLENNEAANLLDKSMRLWCRVEFNSISLRFSYVTKNLQSQWGAHCKPFKNGALSLDTYLSNPFMVMILQLWCRPKK